MGVSYAKQYDKTYYCPRRPYSLAEERVLNRIWKLLRMDAAVLAELSIADYFACLQCECEHYSSLMRALHIWILKYHTPPSFSPILPLSYLCLISTSLSTLYTYVQLYTTINITTNNLEMLHVIMYICYILAYIVCVQQYLFSHICRYVCVK